jgi:hypothetical protein
MVGVAFTKVGQQYTARVSFPAAHPFLEVVVEISVTL